MKAPKIVRYGSAISPLGPMMVGLTQEGFVCRLAFKGKKRSSVILKEWQQVWPQTEFVRSKTSAISALRRIFHDYKTMNVVLYGTPFQHRVWKALLKIPAGTVISYADLARRIKKPKAARAVGNALGANPVPILIPCHRVVARGGQLGGYSGGRKNKRQLLLLENTTISKR